MKTWKIDKAYVNNSMVICSCGIRKSVKNKKLDNYICECVKKVEFSGNLRTLYRQYRYSAIDRGLTFKLSFAHFEYLTGLDCAYCAEPPETRHFNADFTGIDRTDPCKGYIKGNVLPSCKTCNYMKGTLQLDEFIAKIRKVKQRLDIVERVVTKDVENKEECEFRFKLGMYSSPSELLYASRCGIFDLNLIKYNVGESMLDFPEDLNDVILSKNSVYRHTPFGKKLKQATVEVVNKTNSVFEKAKKDESYLDKLMDDTLLMQELIRKGIFKKVRR